MITRVLLTINKKKYFNSFLKKQKKNSLKKYYQICSQFKKYFYIIF